ncbi:hypothetical protein I6G56_26860 [Burkholderia humptydooensis]|uniref:Uncharacterized protein n=1 Tax=Burkholderia humptydooensis TaxID=430531 RepID=A0A7T2U540_9BURK|nr:MULTISPECIES: hypothetical protein [Burkholderia]QPS45764.1 hypothetical protein I6G56_26860 [Burkholderia humptydooensis]
MQQPTVQEFVNGKVVIVALLAGTAEAVITVGPAGRPSHPDKVSIRPFLDAGLSEHEALQRVLQIAIISARGSTS